MANAAYGLCIAVILAGCAPPSHDDDGAANGHLGDSPGASFTNPVVAVDCADPAAIRVADRYILTCTAASALFPIRESADLVHWVDRGTIFGDAGPPQWADWDFFAPEIHPVGDGFVAYYSARDRDAQRYGLGAAYATDPTGPFTDLGGPILLEDTEGVIDVNYFEDDDGTKYLLWKRDGNHQNAGLPTPILIQPLSDDGLTLVGQATELITNDEAWEGPLIEGPWMTKHDGTYYLFYSGNDYETADYGVGVARADSPTGPFENRGAPVLTSNATWVGPGHCSVVETPGGADLMVHHAWRGDHINDLPGRLTLLDPITWGDDGWPVIGDAGTPIVVAQPLPQ